MKINVHNLKPGINEFQFEKSGEDLSLEHEGIAVDVVHVASKIDKRTQSIVVNSKFTADIKQTCDRCLESFLDSIKGDLITYYTSDKETASFDDEQIIQLITQNTTEINLTNGLRESILLSVPMKVVCSEDCKGLCPNCGVNLSEKSCECKNERSDPRWAGLRKLLDKDPVSD